MVFFKSKALKAVVLGASAVTGLGFVVNQQLTAEEKVSDSILVTDLIKTKRDTISAIPDLFQGNDAALSLVQATRAARNLAQQAMAVNGYPGLVVGVSIKGKPCWVQGFGFSNVEAASRCTKDTVMRIASLSKPLTMLGVAKLVEEGKLDLDKNIYEYVGGKFPEKEFDGRKVTMSIRQIASHLAGIRHYNSPDETYNFYKHYYSATDALETFAYDDLVAKPGTKFNYSTFGYTLIAAAIESVLPNGKSFGQYLINDVCRTALGMSHTYLDDSTPIILNRAAQYFRDNQTLENAPYTENSFKYAGGGILSSVPDLLHFGNVMLYSFMPPENSKGFLKKETVDELWTPSRTGRVSLTPNLFRWCQYGLGWGLIRNAQPFHAAGAVPPFKDVIYHTGSATGGTTLLVIIPEKEMVIAIMCNLHSARGIMSLGRDVAQLFGNVKLEPSPIVTNHKEIVVKGA
ncbi:serine beta-lactamase-like protein LACTB, mitochondrial [Tetranychus urticae]|uniref:Beta-lactamase-related domain-containing protein n=1 Tax=Tetranychus urticae TaxID=32264 RepID=T1JVM6_TETUR|nr:serine beta-lactamase-like protein LACTB, mitochondrial [Tetranychus urticae]